MYRQPFGRILQVAAIAALLTSAWPVAHAQVTWTGTTSTSWSDGANWSTSSVPTTGSLAFGFDVPNQPSNNSTTGTYNLLNFLNSSLGSSLTLGGTGTLTLSAATASGTTISNLNTTAGRTVTIQNNLVLSNAQTWSSAASANAITTISGNLSGSGTIMIVGGVASTGTQQPNFRLSGSNSGYTGTIFTGTRGVLLDRPDSMTGGLISISGTAVGNNGDLGGQGNLWLTGGKGTYTFGLEDIGTSARVRFNAMGNRAAGILLTESDVYWNPGGQASFDWSGPNAARDALGGNIQVGGGDAPTTSAPYRLFLGQESGTFTISGLKVIGGGNSLNGRVTLLSALGSGITATTGTLGVAVPVLRLSAAAVSQSGTLNVTVGGNSNWASHGSGLEISDVNQLPNGNLTLGSGSASSAGVLILNNMGSTFNRTSGTGTGQWQITGPNNSGTANWAGFAATGAAATIPNTVGTSAFDTNFALGYSLRNPDNTLYADKGVTIAQNTTLTDTRLVSVANNGMNGYGFSLATQLPASNVLNELSGNLSGTGALVVLGQADFATNINGDRGILVLSGSNSWTGAPVSSAASGATNVFFNAGPGGLIAQRSFVRFGSPGALPTGATSGTSYLVALENTGFANPAGLLVTGGGTATQTYDLTDNYRFLLGSARGAPTGAANAFTSFGADGGKATVKGSSLLLNGTAITHAMFSSFMVLNGSELTLGTGTSNADAFNLIPSSGFSTSAGTSTTYDNATGNRSLFKFGEGTLVLGNVRYTDLALSGTDKSGQFTWQIGPGLSGTGAPGGAVRGLSMSSADANKFNSLKGFYVPFGGGVYEVDNTLGTSGTLAVTLGTAASGTNTILNLSGIGGGGFSAFGGNVQVILNSGSSLTWASTNGFSAGNPLLFGSQTANAVVTLTNNIDFSTGSTREVRVLDNTATSSDYAVLSGTLRNTSNLNKTGPGLLELSAANTFSGTTTVSEGTLRLANNLALQSSILDLGASGTGSVAMATGITAPQFGGLVGNKNLSAVIQNYGTLTTIGLNPSSGTTTYSQSIESNAVGVGVTKTGAGTQVFAGANTYTGATTLAGGVLSLAHANALGGGGNVVFTGGTLQFTGSNTADLSTRVVNSTGAMAFDTNGQNVTFNNPLAATNVGGLTKLGSGTLTVAGSNLYTGTTTVNGGVLRAGGSGTPFGAGTVNLANTGSSQLDINGQTVTVGGLINGGTGGGVVLNSGTLRIGSATVTGTYNGSFTGPGSVVKVGMGTFAYNPAVSSTVSLSIDQGLVSIAPSSGVTLNLGTIGRSTGAGLSLPVIATGTVVASNGLSNGIIGPWALTGTGANLSYATVSSGAVATFTTSTTSAATGLNDTTGATNYIFSGTSGTAAASFSGNTIRYISAAGRLNPGATSFAVNGLMNAGTGLWTIGGTVGSAGTIQSGATRELVVATNTQGVTINSVIADSGSGSSALTFISQGGALTLAGANTFSGDIFMSGAGSGLTLGSGSFHAATTGNVFLSPAATLTINNNGSQSIGNINLGSTLTKTGTGLLTMSSATSSFTGAVSINAGVVSVSSLGMAGSISSLGSGATINLGASDTAATLRYTGGGDTTDRVVNLAGTTGGATLQADGSGAWVLSSPLTASSGVKTLTLSGTSTALNSIGAIPNAGSDALSVNKTDPGTWQLTGNSSYSGRLRVLDGRVIVGSVGELGPSPFGGNENILPIVGDSAATSGTATLLVATGTVQRGVDVSTGGNGQVVVLGGQGAGLSRFNSGVEIRLGRDVTLQASNSGTVEFASTWRDSTGTAAPAVNFTIGSLGNEGTVVFANSVPTSIVSVNVVAGTLAINGNNRMGAGTPLTLGSASSNGTFDLRSFSQRLSALSFTGAGSTVSSMASGTLRLFNNGGTAAVNVVGSGTGHQISSSVALDDNSTFDVAASARLAVSGVIGTGSSGARSLTKTGLGTLELSGQNSYTGNTAVNQGTLVVNGRLAEGALSVAAGATLMGSGTIGGNATIAGIHSPGNSPGIETFSTNLTYTGGTSQVIWELWGNTDSPGSRGALYDGINVGGTLDFAALTTLTLNFGGTGVGVVDWDNAFWSESRQWLLYSVTGTTTNFSNFQLANNPASWVDSTGEAFSASSRNTNTFNVVQSGNNIVLQYVPEPTAITLALIGIAASVYVAARRRS